jgi:hypothetical protein
MDDAPRYRALPALTTSCSASIVSSTGTSGSKRWIWYRSTYSVPEPGERRVDLFEDRLAGQAGSARAVVHPEVHLGGEYDVLAPAVLGDRAADDLLGAAVPVHVGGVPERDAELDGLPEDRLSRASSKRPLAEPPRGVPETHAPQGDPADREP